MAGAKRDPEVEEGKDSLLRMFEKRCCIEEKWCVSNHCMLVGAAGVVRTHAGTAGTVGTAWDIHGISWISRRSTYIHGYPWISMDIARFSNYSSYHCFVSFISVSSTRIYMHFLHLTSTVVPAPLHRRAQIG